MAHDHIRETTLAEIQTLKKEFAAQRDKLTNKLRDHFKVFGFTSSAPRDNRTQLVRAKARELLNGSASAFIEQLPAGESEESFRLQRDAIDEILKTLSNKQTELLAIESLTWSREHGSERRAVHHDLFLAYCMVRGLKAKSEAMSSRAFGAPPEKYDYFFAEWNGWSDDLLKLSEGQFVTAANEAVAGGVATESEIRKALRP